MALDKVTLQILANHYSAAAESMANTLLRTAHSTFVKETEDFTTGLATPYGKTIARPMSSVRPGSRPRLRSCHPAHR